MDDLAGVLAQEAAGVQPVADLDDVLRRATRRRHRARVRRRLAVVGATAAAALVVAVLVGRTQLGRSDEMQLITTPAGPPPVTADELEGLLLPDAGVDQSYRHNTLDRSDPDHAQGAWTMIVRPDGGALGRRSAAITFPAPTAAPADPDVVVRSTTPDGRSLSVVQVTTDAGPVALSAVDLDDREVAALARVITVVDGRPVVALDGALDDVGELNGFEVVAQGPDRSPVVREARYGCDSLGVDDILGAFCYTGTATSPGFEAALHRAGFEVGPPIDGRPSLVSGVAGGNGTLAWEVRPGVIAYVGYSGNLLGDDQVAALAELAARATLIGPEAWADTNPQVVTHPNTW